MTNETDHVTAGVGLSTKPDKKKNSSYGQPWTIEEQVKWRQEKRDWEGRRHGERENNKIVFPFVETTGGFIENISIRGS